VRSVSGRMRSPRPAANTMARVFRGLIIAFEFRVGS
jgi:hypothetical protein